MCTFTFTKGSDKGSVEGIIEFISCSRKSSCILYRTRLPLLLPGCVWTEEEEEIKLPGRRWVEVWSNVPWSDMPCGIVQAIAKQNLCSVKQTI